MLRIYQRLLASLRYRSKHAFLEAEHKIRRFAHNQIVRHIVLPAVYSPRLRQYKPRPPAQRAPCFLLLRHKHAGDARFGEPREEHFLSAPLRSAKIAETVEYYYDLDYPGGIFGESKLVDLVTRVRPDLIIMSSYDHRNNDHPSFQVLTAIRSKCGIPLVGVWCDLLGKGAMARWSFVSNGIDLNILIDSGALAKHFPDRNDIIRLWAPVPFGVFHPGDGKRDIPVSFLGSIGSYRNVRAEYLDYLKGQHLDIYHTGGMREQPISLERYADILRRSKISLNFSQSVPGTHQLKGRVFEVLFSGTLLMESENAETPQYFTPMVDYVVFDSKQDLVDKVRYYLEHEDERQRIAYNGYIRATTEYNHNVFWNKVMGKLEELNLIGSRVSTGDS